jgi:hypothetical protein
VDLGGLSFGLDLTTDLVEQLFKWGSILLGKMRLLRSAVTVLHRDIRN